ncbi:hypothetical protein Tsubulata_036251 [Turnera subulata]|uniref:Uncharacterized protein n=1 Tax=Turnera subulata TaxID=218843 RepID=A0A9Q0FZE5_9ROSI|nr:hypothetical protein Tsubulata_036251 [Turnera subulata]
MKAAASSDPTHNRPSIFSNLKSLTRTAIVIGVTASMACKLSLLPAKAETPASLAGQAPTTLHEEEEAAEAAEQRHSPDSVESLKSLLQQKLDGGEDEAALGILTRLVSAQPAVAEWKFLQGRLLGEMGRAWDARQVFKEILAESSVIRGPVRERDPDGPVRGRRSRHGEVAGGAECRGGGA